jgi:hypothetical protein
MDIVVVILCCSSFSVSVKLSPCAKWNKTASTVSNVGRLNISSPPFYEPRVIFIHKQTNVLYFANALRRYIGKLPLNRSSNVSTIVASTEYSAYRIYVDDDNDGPTIYASLTSGHRVEKWIYGSSSGIQVGSECSFCRGLSVNKVKNVYMSTGNHVLKWSPKTNTTRSSLAKLANQGQWVNIYHCHKTSISIKSIGLYMWLTHIIIEFKNGQLVPKLASQWLSQALVCMVPMLHRCITHTLC